MKHRVGFNRLSRRQGHRKALKNNMVTSLFRYERVETTKAKALEVRRAAEKMVTRARIDSVHNRRIIGQRIHDQEILAKLFTDIAPRYVERPGGYTRVLKIGRRQGDAAEMVILELVDRKIEEKPVREKPSEPAKEEAAVATEEAAEAESDESVEEGADEAPKARVGGTKGTKAPTKKAAAKKAAEKPQEAKAEASDEGEPEVSEVAEDAESGSPAPEAATDEPPAEKAEEEPEPEEGKEEAAESETAESKKEAPDEKGDA